jgi:type IV pilus assembly protein PilA
MVVVLIIGILIAIALPTFLGARERAQNRAAQSSLRNALVAAKTLYTDNDDYATADDAAATGLPSVEPSLTYSQVQSTGPNNVSVHIDDALNAGDAQVWAAAALSESGKCFWIKDVAVGTPGAGTYFGGDATGAACAGTDAMGAASPKFP